MYQIIYRSRESLDDERNRVGFGSTSILNSKREFNSTLAIPQNGYNQNAPGSSSHHSYQNLRTTHPSCHSSTPKISNNFESMKQPSLFPSDEVSPVVLRDKKNRNMRTNMVQNSSKNIGNQSFYNNFLSNKNLTKPSILVTPSPSMMNLNYCSNYNGSGVEGVKYCGVNTDGVIMNPVLLHREQVQKMNENDSNKYIRSASTPWGHSSPIYFNSITPTNIDPNLSRSNVLHEHLEKNRFSVSRKASPTKVDYNNTKGAFPNHINYGSDLYIQNNLNHTMVPRIIEPTRNGYVAERPISAHEQLLWKSGLKPPTTNSDQERKLSSPAQLGGISMDNIGATGNSIYLRHGASFNCLNMVLTNIASDFI